MAEQASAEYVVYRCRRCARLLFESDAAVGRVKVICPDRRCKTAQVVFLGGQQTKGDRARVLVRAG